MNDPPPGQVITEGLVFTVEPFLSLGADWAEDGGNGDPWTLYSEPRALTVQYEHTIVATKNGLPKRPTEMQIRSSTCAPAEPAMVATAAAVQSSF